jgi:hypothetical protein
MENKELLSGISAETKQKLAECKTKDEILKVLAEAGVEPVDDELLDAVAGGVPYLFPETVFEKFR